MSNKIKVNWIDMKKKQDAPVTNEVPQTKEEATQPIIQKEDVPSVVETQPTSKLEQSEFAPSIRQPMKIDFSEEPTKTVEQPREQFDPEKYILRKFNEMRSPQPVINIPKPQQAQMIIKKRQRKFDFSFKNPLGNIMENPYILAGALMGVFILQQKYF